MKVQEKRQGIPVWRDMGNSPMPSGGDEPEIVIVGGGPVGLTLALDLGRRGRKVVVLNKRDFVAAGSKAICFSKRTLDIWNRLGIGQAMVAKGVVWNLGKVFRGDRQEPIYTFDMLPVKDQEMPGFINLQQYHCEDILVAALDCLPSVNVRWGHEVSNVHPDADSVRVDVVTSQGDYTIETPWVIACDGNTSPVRTMLGLDFDGRIFEDNFLIADVRLKQERPAERWFWFDPPFNPGQSALLHKQPDDVWRLDFQLGWNIDREACIRPENVEPYVRGMLGDDIEFEQEWYSVYTFQCRRMARFTHGRVIFAGDSAHLVSPFGARGCNGGVADVDNLAWKLELVLDGRAGAELIASYDHEATLTADVNIMNSSRSTDFLTPKNSGSRLLRDCVLDLAEAHTWLRPFVNSGRLSTAIAYPDSPLNTPDAEGDIWHGGVPPGGVALDAPLAGGWLLGAMAGGDFVLLTCGPLRAVPQGVAQVILSDETDPAGIARLRYDLEAGSACLVRPDQYVAARWRNPELHLIEAALHKARGNA